MAKEPDNRIDDLVKEFKDFRADERKRSDENAKSMSDMKVQQSEFKSRFNTLMGVLAGAVGLVVLLTSTITKIVFDQNAHSASTDTRLSTIESHLSTFTDKTNTIAEAAQKQPHQIKSVADAVDDLKNIVPSLTDAVLSGQKDQNTLFIFSSSPDRIMDRLSGSGITASLLVTDLVQSLNLGPIWQASDSLSPRAPGSASPTFF